MGVFCIAIVLFLQVRRTPICNLFTAHVIIHNMQLFKAHNEKILKKLERPNLLQKIIHKLLWLLCTGESCYFSMKSSDIRKLQNTFQLFLKYKLICSIFPVCVTFLLIIFSLTSCSAPLSSQWCGGIHWSTNRSCCLVQTMYLWVV